VRPDAVRARAIHNPIAEKQLAGRAAHTMFTDFHAAAGEPVHANQVHPWPKGEQLSRAGSVTKPRPTDRTSPVHR
jgi:hypothetical protein